MTGLRRLATPLVVVGGLLTAAGAALSCQRNGLQEFCYSWLFAFLFYYSIALGALFVVMVHHLTSAGWSVGIRRFSEHLASLLFPWLAILFLPVAVFARATYSWMNLDPGLNNEVAAKLPVFTAPGFYVTSAVFFGIWWFLSSRLSRLSLQQDETGAPELYHKMRFHSGWGIVVFALVLTFSFVLWMQALSYQWFSAIYGVYLFANCIWVGLATIYVLAAVLWKQGVLKGVMREQYFYFLGVLLLGFTLLAAYGEFAQYFVVWNANMPEETFWYLIRENGNWWTLSMILILGKVFVPFFVLLPVKVKTNFKVLIPTCALIWAMYALDLAFNVFPSLHEYGYHLKWLWLPIGCLMFMGGFLVKIFLKKLDAHPPFPQRDPHLLEAMGVSTHTVNDLVDAKTGGAR